MRNRHWARPILRIELQHAPSRMAKQTHAAREAEVIPRQADLRVYRVQAPGLGPQQGRNPTAKQQGNSEGTWRRLGRGPRRGKAPRREEIVAAGLPTVAHVSGAQPCRRLAQRARRRWRRRSRAASPTARAGPPRRGPRPAGAAWPGCRPRPPQLSEHSGRRAMAYDDAAQRAGPGKTMRALPAMASSTVVAVRNVSAAQAREGVEVDLPHRHPCSAASSRSRPLASTPG